MSGSVLISVLHWGRPEVTARCLTALERISYPRVTFVVVDNAAEGQRVKRLVEQLPRAEYVCPQSNLGFSAGHNIGLRLVLERGIDYALLLNNDVVVDPGFLEPLVACAESAHDIGLVNAKILYARPRGRIWFADGRYSPWSGMVRHVDRFQIDDADDNACQRTTFATGCLLLIPYGTLQRVGLLDESLFMYAEDLDFSIRAQAAGLQIRVARASRVVHYEHARTEHPLRIRLATRNLLRVNWRHSHWLQRATLVPSFTLRWILYMIVRGIVRSRWGEAQAVLRGVWDGLRGRSGPISR